MFVYTFTKERETSRESNSENCHDCSPVCACQFGVGIKGRSLALSVTVTIQPLIKAHLQRRSEANKQTNKQTI